MYVYVYVHVYVCMYVCMYIYIYIYIYTHTSGFGGPGAASDPRPHDVTLHNIIYTYVS